MKWLASYPKEVKVFLLASLINAAGSALMWPLITMFIFKELGRTMTDAGLAIMIHSLGGIVGQLLGGALYHRIGVKRLIVGSLILNALALLLLPYGSQNWHLFMGLLLLGGFSNAMSMPAIQAFVGFRFADRRGQLFNVIYVANNIGVALGTALSGVLAQISYHLSFVMNGFTCLVFAIFFFVYLNKVEQQEGGLHVHKKKSAAQGLRVSTLLMNYRIYLFMGLGSLFLWLGNSIWNNGVSPYTISKGAPEWHYSILWTLNGILIFVGQPVVSWIKRVCAGSSQAQMAASAVFYLAGYICILTVHTYPAIVGAMILTTFGEMLISPAIPAFISDHTAKAAPFYLGLVGGISAGGRVLGPYAMGVLYDQGGLVPVAWLSVIVAILSLSMFVVHAWMYRNKVSSLPLSL
ncbi:MFS family permease [Paenibacillus shirakamiensis]|uniref:MFS family permease n=1 Tax=Paenibacillus shirakamiensis TaxID=1265935 RepID=A0ABS4JLA8_9BACL|nr:MFS transporter [Paenibacillus shirakamiensis]MBP2001865.1 MFS family permease [Paenibacillus shirakamiensis]